MTFKIRERDMRSSHVTYLSRMTRLTDENAPEDAAVCASHRQHVLYLTYVVFSLITYELLLYTKIIIIFISLFFYFIWYIFIYFIIYTERKKKHLLLDHIN